VGPRTGVNGPPSRSAVTMPKTLPRFQMMCGTKTVVQVSAV